MDIISSEPSQLKACHKTGGFAMEFDGTFEGLYTALCGARVLFSNSSWERELVYWTNNVLQTCKPRIPDTVVVLITGATYLRLVSSRPSWGRSVVVDLRDVRAVIQNENEKNSKCASQMARSVAYTAAATAVAVVIGAVFLKRCL
jgi:hypothetical protein